MYIVATLFLIIGVLLLPIPCMALMPPHITGSIPESGDVLTTDTIILEGYTLYRPESGQLTLTDITSGQSASWEVADLTCQEEGDRKRAEIEEGVMQYRCVLRIRLTEPVAGHVYELSFLEWTIGFTYVPGEDAL